MKASKYFRLKEKWAREKEKKTVVVSVEPVPAVEPIILDLEPEVEPEETVEEVSLEPVDNQEPVVKIFTERTLVRDAAKTLDLTNKELIEKLAEHGVKASHSSKTDPEVLNKIAEEL